MFHVDARQLIKYEHKLRTLSSTAISYAERQALNDVAFTARREALDRIGKQLTIRNKFTQKSIRVEKAVKGSVGSRIGSTVDYMARQEFGGSTAKSGRIGVPIPTTYSSGEGMQAKVRRRMPRKANMLRNINLSGKGLRGGVKQRNAIAIRTAPRGGTVYLDLGKRKGMFRVLGTNRRTVKMVWDLTRGRTLTPSNPWLKPSSVAANSYMYAYYRKALIYQLNRLGARS